MTIVNSWLLIGAIIGLSAVACWIIEQVDIAIQQRIRKGDG